MLYELIPNMPKHRLAPLMAAFPKPSRKPAHSAVCLSSQSEGMIEAQPTHQRRVDGKTAIAPKC